MSSSEFEKNLGAEPRQTAARLESAEPLSPEQRAALKRDLKPLISIYEEL